MQIPNSSAVERTAVNRQVDGSTPSWGGYQLSLICISPNLITLLFCLQNKRQCHTLFTMLWPILSHCLQCVDWSKDWQREIWWWHGAEIADWLVEETSNLTFSPIFENHQYSQQLIIKWDKRQTLRRYDWNKTNKRFDSLWYNKLHYSRLVRDELVTKSYIEQVFAQASVPRNLWSFSPSFKRGRGLILYLSPDKCRAAKSTKLRLRKFTPLLHRGTNTAQEIKPVLTYMSDQDTCLSHYTIYHLRMQGLCWRRKLGHCRKSDFLFISY